MRLWVQTSARAFGMPATRYGASPKFGGSANNHASAGHHPAAELSDSAAVSLRLDRKSTRLNSSHSQISYAVFCLKKKKSDQLTHAQFRHHHIQTLTYDRFFHLQNRSFHVTTVYYITK